MRSRRASGSFSSSFSATSAPTSGGVALALVLAATGCEGVLGLVPLQGGQAGAAQGGAGGGQGGSAGGQGGQGGVAGGGQGGQGGQGGAAGGGEGGVGGVGGGGQGGQGGVAGGGAGGGGAPPLCTGWAGPLGYDALVGSEEGAAAVEALALDEAGGIYLAGPSYSSDLDFGGGVIATSSYLVRVSPQGAVTLNVGLETGAMAVGAHEALWSGEHVVVGGEFHGTLMVGATPLTGVHATDNPFLAAYAPDGTGVWGVSLGGPEPRRLTALASDLEGGVLASVVGAGALDLGPACTLSGTGNAAFLVRFDATGACTWGARLPLDLGLDHLTLARSPLDGALVVAGSTGENTYFGGVAGVDEAFVMTLDLSTPGVSVIAGPLFLGSPSGTSGFGHDRWIEAVGVDNCGRIIAAGAFLDDLEIDGVDYASSDPGPSKHDLFVLGLDATLSPLWHLVASDAGRQEPLGLAVSPEGAVVLVGKLYETAASQHISFGGGPLVGPVDNTDAFVAVLRSADGEHVQSFRFGDSSDDSEQDARAVRATATSFVVGGRYFSEVKVAQALGASKTSPGYGAYATRFDVP